MAVFSKFEILSEYLMKGVLDFSVDTFKVMLSNTAPNQATNTVKADIVEIAAGNGYVAGGIALTNSFARAGAVSTYTSSTNPLWTAAGGTMATFRYSVMYCSSIVAPVNQPLVGYWDHGTSISLPVGIGFTVDITLVNALLKLTVL
jgi:hypothetical protein